MVLSRLVAQPLCHYSRGWFMVHLGFQVHYLSAEHIVALYNLKWSMLGLEPSFEAKMAMMSFSNPHKCDG